MSALCLVSQVRFDEKYPLAEEQTASHVSAVVRVMHFGLRVGCEVTVSNPSLKGSMQLHAGLTLVNHPGKVLCKPDFTAKEILS